MTKCLVTKLNGSVDNKELLKIGEMRIKVESVESPTKSTQGFKCSFSEPTTLEIVGDGYFTDEKLTANFGKSKVVSDSEEVFVNQATTISVRGKYSLSSLELITNKIKPYGSNKVFSIDDLKYSPNLKQIEIPSTQAFGDIASFANKTALVSLNMENTNLTGDIEAIKNDTALNKLILSGTRVTGDIANLKNLINLTYLNLTDIQVAGDIAQLEPCSKITYLLAPNNVTGDLSKLPKECYMAKFSKTSITSFTWTSRPSSYNIFATEGKIKVDNIDKMLQDLAQCQTAYPSSGEIWYKTINIIGTRTSVSDSALQALQSKGYTVSITPA